MSGLGRLEGKSALVTGAGSGLGRATAMRFATEGARVMCTDVNAAASHATAAAIREAGGIAETERLDVTDAAAAGLAVARAQEAHGPVDVLMHSAGIDGNGTALSTPADAWRRVLAVNLTGTWVMSQAVLPGMVAGGCGSIINVASVAGVMAVPGSASYSASKGGVVAFTRQVAIDFAAAGIRVNVICPGTVPTPLVLRSYAERGALDPTDPESGLARAQARYPLGRLGTPDDIASMALFLASDESTWMTGAVLPVDGGVTMAAWGVDQ